MKKYEKWEVRTKNKKTTKREMIKVVQLSGQQARELNSQVINSNILYVEAEDGKYEKKKFERWSLHNGEKDLMEGVQLVYPHEAKAINDEDMNYMYFAVEEKAKTSPELEEARARFEEVTGEKAHHKMSIKKIEEKISNFNNDKKEA